MRKRTRALAMTLAFCPAARAESGITARVPGRSGRTKGLNLMASVLAAPAGEWKPSGFLLGWGVEQSGPGDADFNVGMSYLRLKGFGAPVTLVNLLDLTMSGQGATTFIFGSSLGAADAQGRTRMAMRLFLGVEFFHRRALPVDLAVDLIVKMCEGNKNHECPEQEQQTWVAGRLGFRF